MRQKYQWVNRKINKVSSILMHKFKPFVVIPEIAKPQAYIGKVQLVNNNYRLFFLEKKHYI